MSKTKTAALCMAALMAISGCGKIDEPKGSVNNAVRTTKATAANGETLPEKYIITCAEIAYKTINEYDGELPVTMEVTDDVMISDVLQYDMSLADDFSVYMQMLSTDLFELTVIRTSEDNLDAVKKMLETRLAYLKEQAAYYPAQVAAAEAGVTGEINGVCYLICSERAADLEKRVMYYVLRN